MCQARFCPHRQQNSKKVLIKLCKKKTIYRGDFLCKGNCCQLLRNEIPIQDLTMSKQLTRRPEDYKNPAPHTELAKRLQATQPAHIAPKTGDRIDFLIRPGYKGEKTFMRSVSPEDVQEGRATADTRWYLSNQLQQPLQRIFEMIMENSSDIFEVSEVCQPQVVANDMMRGFVQRTSRDQRPKRAPDQLHKPKKKKKLTTMNIAAFFK